MALNTLKINALRNVDAAVLDGLGQINVIFGENASGKTSVLEAIHLLGTARSFRSLKNSSIIKNGSKSLIVHATLDDFTSIGVQKKRSANHRYQINNNAVLTSAELASRLPLQLINSDSFLLLGGPPSQRRAFLDQGVFHVEPGFLPCWKRAQKALKQRNNILRRGRIDYSELRPWDKELIENTEIIDRLRSAYLTEFEDVFSGALLGLFDFSEKVSISYQAGWDTSLSSFDEALKSAFSRDVSYGYSTIGPHKADIQIRVGDKRAIDVLSRGQQKVLVSLMQVAQGLKIANLTGKKSVFLVDDLSSELDKQNRNRLFHLLCKTGSQVFITVIDRNDVDFCINEPGFAGSATDTFVGGESTTKEGAVWFHVEHGEVTKQ